MFRGRVKEKQRRKERSRGGERESHAHSKIRHLLGKRGERKKGKKKKKEKCACACRSITTWAPLSEKKKKGRKPVKEGGLLRRPNPLRSASDRKREGVTLNKRKGDRRDSPFLSTSISIFTDNKRKELCKKKKRNLFNLFY